MCGWYEARNKASVLNLAIILRALLKFSRKQSFEFVFVIKARFKILMLPFTALTVSYNGRRRYLIHCIYNIFLFCRHRFTCDSPGLLQLQLWCNLESGLFCWFHFFSLHWDSFRFSDLPANRFWRYRLAWKGKLLVLICYEYSWRVLSVQQISMSRFLT